MSEQATICIRPLWVRLMHAAIFGVVQASGAVGLHALGILSVYWYAIGVSATCAFYFGERTGAER